MKSKVYFGLHLLLFIYSLTGIFSKWASSQSPLTPGFLVCYGMVLLILFVYAIGWQQVIKRVPLSFAFANKAATVVWGIAWGFIVFQEPLNAWKLVGAGAIIVGIALFSLSDEASWRDGGEDGVHA